MGARRTVFLGIFLLGLGFVVHAMADVPSCLDGDERHEVPINNRQVLYWKNSTSDDFHARGHVHGTVREVYHPQTGHMHFSIQLDTGRDQTIEIVYSEKFGRLPRLQAGDDIEACGDYITSQHPYHGYPASPDGAIVHWVHRSDSDSHPSGYVAVNGDVYGQD